MKPTRLLQIVGLSAFLGLATLALPLPAHAWMRVSIGLPLPVPVFAPAPVVVAPQPVYVQPAPAVVYQEPAVVYHERAVVYQEPAVVYREPAWYTAQQVVGGLRYAVDDSPRSGYRRVLWRPQHRQVHARPHRHTRASCLCR